MRDVFDRADPGGRAHGDVGIAVAAGLAVVGLVAVGLVADRVGDGLAAVDAVAGDFVAVDVVGDAWVASDFRGASSARWSPVDLDLSVVSRPGAVSGWCDARDVGAVSDSSPPLPPAGWEARRARRAGGAVRVVSRRARAGGLRCVSEFLSGAVAPSRDEVRAGSCRLGREPPERFPRACGPPVVAVCFRAPRDDRTEPESSSALDEVAGRYPSARKAPSAGALNSRRPGRRSAALVARRGSSPVARPPGCLTRSPALALVRLLVSCSVWLSDPGAAR